MSGSSNAYNLGGAGSQQAQVQGSAGQMQESQSKQPSSSPSPAKISSTMPVSDEVVLAYLKSKGMSTAILELQERLKQESKTENGTVSDDAMDQKQQMKKMKEQLDHDDDLARSQRSALFKSTGGGFGYDRDAAAPIVQWGIPDNTSHDDSGKSPSTKKKKQQYFSSHLGEKEAQAYLDAFTALQLWVLTLPDDPEGGSCIQPKTHNPIAKAQELIEKQNGPDKKKISLSSIITEMAKPVVPDNQDEDITFHLPPSAKPELLAVTFALLVHTYCELLEVGMETTAHVLRDTFGPSIYEPIYGEQLKDLFQCTTTDDMVKLNAHNSQHMEALASVKQILVRIAEYQLKQEEIKNAPLPKSDNPASAEQVRKQEIARYQQAITSLQMKHKELSQRASSAFDRMYDLPFLRRARAVRWQLTLSTSAYGLLGSFLNNNASQSSLLAMSTLLQTKCELHVEQRDPLPFTPAVLLDDQKNDDNNFQDALCNWASPYPAKDSKKDRPYPKFHLDEEYMDEASAKRDKKTVEFNRALLVYGFRRLEALERKREFQVMKNSDKSTTTQAANPFEPSILLSTLSANTGVVSVKSKTGALSALSPQSPAPARGNSSSSSNHKSPMTAAMWEEAGIGLTCAKLCPPDGRRVAIGCDDSAIRVWDLMDLQKDGTAGDPAQVLLGHKNGFPVFGLSWNRDGRSLLSAGGDGTVRLWDTMLQGPFGEVATNLSSTSTTLTSSKTTNAKNITNSIAKETLLNATQNLEKAKTKPGMNVPGLKPESEVQASSGAALAVYRHAEQKPIWSVDFAPSGYYFASAGADGTARLWTTDRVLPVRMFCGHTANSVNSVVFHPNCNYILTGCDDKTARLWDIQTGRCVRLLNGCSAGIYQVKIDPSGQYAVGADAKGTVHLWDLGTGKKVSEFRSPTASGRSAKTNRALIQSNQNMAMAHSLSFSSCGKALASGGDDQCVRIWDIRKSIEGDSVVIDMPVKTLTTRRTMLLDLHYTKRNLLLSVGKYISQ